MSVVSPFVDASLDVGPCRRMRAFACDEDHVRCAVQFAIAASVEPVADGLTR